MKANKLMIAALMMGAMAMVGCKPSNGNDPDEPIIPGGNDTTQQATQPEVEPIEGACVVVCNFLQAPCGDVIFVGSYTKQDGTAVSWTLGDPSEKFTPIEGFEGWYQVVLYPNAEADGDGYIARGKAVHVGADGKYAWSGQWDRNSVTLIDGDVAMGDENNGEQFLGFSATGAVAYISANGWQVNPCTEAVPGGNHEWTVVLADTCDLLPANATLYFTGNFGENNKEWGASDRVMTKVNDRTYTWTGEYPENFMCKAFYTVEGEVNEKGEAVQHWAEGNNYIFDGKNYTYTVGKFQ